LNKKAVAAALLALMSISFSLMPLLQVHGQLGTSILQITPTEGVAGELVNVQGTIDTTNGAYQLYLGGKLVASNTSEGFYVNANFTVPELSEGDYVLTLRDVARRINATETFTINIGYSIQAATPSAPAQLQEGSNVVLNVKLTGGHSGTTYYANVTVELPEPLETEYSQFVTLALSDQTGTASAQVTFPGGGFQPSGSLTDFTGTYSAYFNKTQQLASSQFFVGFTDAGEYHREQSVAIRAVGYLPDQPAALSITNNETGTTMLSENVNASSDGVITASWTVPNNAAIGTYKVTITPEGTPKSIVDTQLLRIPGYRVRFHTLNLAGDAVPLTLVEAKDEATGETYDGTSGNDGVATVNLEKGNHNVTAFWNDVKVGEVGISVTEASTFDLACELTNLRIVVKDKSGFLIPSVNLNITYQYTIRDGSSKTGGASGETDFSGMFSLESTLPRIDYEIDASVYGIVFNSDNNTFSNLPAVATYEITILLPSRNLTLNVLDYNLDAIPNTRLALAEQTSGVFYASSTGDAGTAFVEIAFGKYQLRVYKDNVLLNETVIEAFSDKQADIRCILYNLQVSAVVVDYFGQPIPNANVVYRGPDGKSQSETTQTDGVATFAKVFGGDAQIIAYLSGRENYYEAINLQVTSPTAVQIRMGKYVLLGSIVMETSLFASLIIIFAVVAVFLIWEVYRRRRRVKPAKTQARSDTSRK
jgi:hypothetical protein